MNAPIDHQILDRIVEMLMDFEGWGLERKSECIEFDADDGKRYEIVVREIEAE